MRKSIVIVSLTAALWLCDAIACGDHGRNNEWDYDKPLGIDTVIALDTVALHDSVYVVYTFPAGCNHLKSLTYDIASDTVNVSLIWNYFFHGAPCAHGSGVDTTILPLVFPSTGEFRIAYTKPDSSIATLIAIVQ